MNREPLRPIRDEERARFERDGVVHLRGLFDGEWIERMARAIDRRLAAPGPRARVYSPPGSPGRFFWDSLMWQTDGDFEALAFESPMPAIAAALMGSRERVNLYEDTLLVKEPHTEEWAPWHQDQPYLFVDGAQVSAMWLSLDVVDKASGGVEYVRGSHRWGRWFAPVDIATGQTFGGSDLEPLFDVEAERGKLDIVSFDLQPGDCVVHHGLIVHCSPGNRSDRRRRAIVVRVHGDDGVHAARAGAPASKQEANVPLGAPLEAPIHPRIWPR